MKPLNAAPLALLLVSTWLAGPAQAQPQLEVSFDQQWQPADAALRLRLQSGTLPATPELRVFIGTRDVSPLLRWTGPGMLELVPAGQTWPAGESELVLYDAQWTEIARWPLRVLNASGLESSQFESKLDLQADRRAASRHGEGTPLTPRSSLTEGGGLGGFGWKGARAGWQWEAAANVSGHSQRAKALRFGELAGDAPKLDLADYRVAAAWGQHRLELGHVSAGTHALLAQGVASRGLGLSTRAGERADLSLHVVGGSAIVGWDDPLGLQEQDHRMQVLTLGLELLDGRPGGLRAELSVIDASVLPRSGFNTGSVPDAEQSRGLGLRLLASSAGGRLRGELAVARSRYTNPFDDTLALDGELRAVQPVARNAHSAELQAGLLQQWPVGAQALDLTLTLRHDRAAPLYRSLASFVTSDLAQTRVGLQAGLAGASAQLQAVHKVDNLARVATLLRTRTQELQAALNLPLAQWLGGDGASFWPTLAWTAQQVHQQAANTPVAEDSGFADSQRPDQMSTNHQINLNWTLSQGALSYGLSRAVQDNRQRGREQADFHQLGHEIGLSWAFGEALRTSLSVTRSRQLSVETAVKSWTTSGSLTFEWQATERWGLQASAAHNGSRRGTGIAPDLARTRNTLLQAQISWRFAVPGLAKPLPGQAFLRLASQTDRQQDIAFGQDTRLRHGWLDLGLSFSFF
ncbi:MAG: hypothetical protein Q7U99_08595 [Rubrivivax sp.]|nr:hypothetical protein [Rubrivivax sp.]